MRVKNVVVGIVAAVTLCLAGAGFVSAQSVPPPPALPAPTPQAAVHVTTRIVQVSVTVHDKDGHPVTGLTKDDFTLLDEGQRQQIASFSVQTNQHTASAVAAPNVFTNRFDQGVAQPPLTVVVIDAYNARYWDLYPPEYGGMCPPICAIGSLFQEVEKFIAHVQPQDRVALYILVGKLYLLQDFTNDPAALQRAIPRAKDYSNSFHFARPEMDQVDLDTHTMDAMQAIANRLANVPGRKSLVWLTTGYPSVALYDGGVVVTYDKMGKASKTLGNADLPLFAIDAKGFVAPLGGGGGPVPRAGSRGPMAAVGPPPSKSPDGCNDWLTACPPLVRDFEFSKNLADTTGGRAFYNTNDLAGAIRQAMDDSAVTYVLGYYPDHNKWNGEFRDIKVKVDRPGVEVRSRSGYYAVAVTGSASEQAAEKFAQALKSPLESTDLGFDIQADGVEVSGARQLKVKISLDASQLRFEQQAARWTDNITETWAQFSAEGEEVGAKSQTINLKPTQEAYQQLLKQGLNFSETVPLEKNAAEVRLVLRDAGNGAIGSVIIPLSRLFAPAAVGPKTNK